MNFFRRWVWNFLTRHFGDAQGGVLIPCFTGPARGLRLHLRPLDGEISKVRAFYPNQLFDRVQGYCSKSRCVWNCGTEIGYVTALLGRWVPQGGSVIAFDPDPEAIKRTQINALVNQMRHIHFIPHYPAEASEFQDSGIAPDFVHARAESISDRFLSGIIALKSRPVLWLENSLSRKAQLEAAGYRCVYEERGHQIWERD